MNRRSLFLLPLLLLTLSATVLHAQAKFAIYGTGGVEKSGLPDQDWKTAATFGFYYGLIHVPFSAVSVDFRGDVSDNIKSGFAGPRIAFHIPLIPIKPYAEALVGASTYPTLPNGIHEPTQLAGRVVFGGDATILPHIDWRVVDFSYGLNVSANGDRAKTITSGLVLRF
jgi:hypothetical protein